jgi:hypothetical protein
LRLPRTTGLTSAQLRELVKLVSQRVTWSKGRGRPKATGLSKAVVIALAYLRQNMVQEVIGEFFEVSQSTVSRVIRDLTPVVAEVLDEFIPNAAEATKGRVVLVDGTLVPCWSWADHRELYSGKHTAPRRRPVVYPTQSGGIGGIFLGLMPNLAPKG